MKIVPRARKGPGALLSGFGVDQGDDVVNGPAPVHLADRADPALLRHGVAAPGDRVVHGGLGARVGAGMAVKDDQGGPVEGALPDEHHHRLCRKGELAGLAFAEVPGSGVAVGPDAAVALAGQRGGVGRDGLLQCVQR